MFVTPGSACPPNACMFDLLVGSWPKTCDPSEAAGGVATPPAAKPAAVSALCLGHLRARGVLERLRRRLPFVPNSNR